MIAFRLWLLIMGAMSPVRGFQNERDMFRFGFQREPNFRRLERGMLRVEQGRDTVIGPFGGYKRKLAIGVGESGTVLLGGNASVAGNCHY